MKKNRYYIFSLVLIQVLVLLSVRCTHILEDDIVPVYVGKWWTEKWSGQQLEMTESSFEWEFTIGDPLQDSIIIHKLMGNIITDNDSIFFIINTDKVTERSDYYGFTYVIRRGTKKFYDLYGAGVKNYQYNYDVMNGRLILTNDQERIVYQKLNLK